MSYFVGFSENITTFVIECIFVGYPIKEKEAFTVC